VAFGAWFFFGRESREANQLRMKSIAVLPFSPFGRTFDDSVFADGIHDDILTQLSKVSGLRVIARTSMVLYRDSKKTPRQIGDDLDAGYLLEGSTRRSGGKTRITAQLINTADEGHLWAETYDRNDADVFAVQSDIAQRISSSMAIVLSPAERASVEEIPTTSKEAYDCYLQGNYYWGYIDSAGNAKAAELYEEATKFDSTFAQAYARAAAANGAMYAVWDHTPVRYARMASALERAHVLNPEDPEVHWAQGQYFEYVDTVRGVTARLKMALEEYQKALMTRPNWADLRRDIGTVLWRQGLLTQARESIRRYVSLSPMGLASGWGPWTISSWLKEWDVARKEIDEYVARRPDDLEGYRDKQRILIDGFGDLEKARAVLEDGMKLPLNQGRDPGFVITTDTFWEVNYLGGRYQEALTCLAGRPGENVDAGFQHWIQKGVTYVALDQRQRALVCFDSALSYAGRQATEYLKHVRTGIALAWRGDHKKAKLELEKAGRLDLDWAQRKEFEGIWAVSAVLAGDTDTALSLLEKLLAEPGLLTPWWLRLDPVYNPLRSNPRFQALVAKAP
jgi:TolB-like protein/tetratricopeptide (TPR) repeat protein